MPKRARCALGCEGVLRSAAALLVRFYALGNGCLLGARPALSPQPVYGRRGCVGSPCLSVGLEGLVGGARARRGYPAGSSREQRKQAAGRGGSRSAVTGEGPAAGERGGDAEAGSWTRGHGEPARGGGLQQPGSPASHTAHTGSSHPGRCSSCPCCRSRRECCALLLPPAAQQAAAVLGPISRSCAIQSLLCSMAAAARPPTSCAGSWPAVGELTEQAHAARQGALRPGMRVWQWRGSEPVPPWLPPPRSWAVSRAGRAATDGQLLCSSQPSAAPESRQACG